LTEAIYPHFSLLVSTSSDAAQKTVKTRCGKSYWGLLPQYSSLRLQTKKEALGMKSKRIHFILLMVICMVLASVPNVLAASLTHASGKLTYMRAHAVGSKWGPPGDVIDADIIIKLDTKPNMAFGFQLRDDNSDTALRQAMFDILRLAYKNNLQAYIDYWIDPGKKNGLIHRVWISK
jgi:hypothetical protein